MKMKSNVSFTIMGYHFSSNQNEEVTKEHLKVLETQVPGLKIEKIERISDPIPAQYKVSGTYTTSVDAVNKEEGAKKALQSWAESCSDRMFWKTCTTFVSVEPQKKPLKGDSGYEK